METFSICRKKSVSRHLSAWFYSFRPGFGESALNVGVQSHTRMPAAAEIVTSRNSSDGHRQPRPLAVQPENSTK